MDRFKFVFIICILSGAHASPKVCTFGFYDNATLVPKNQDEVMWMETMINVTEPHPYLSICLQISFYKIYKDNNIIFSINGTMGAAMNRDAIYIYGGDGNFAIPIEIPFHVWNSICFVLGRQKGIFYNGIAYFEPESEIEENFNFEGELPVDIGVPAKVFDPNTRITPAMRVTLPNIFLERISLEEATHGLSCGTEDIGHTLAKSEIKDITWTLSTQDSPEILLISENYNYSNEPDDAPCIVKRGSSDIPSSLKPPEPEPEQKVEDLVKQTVLKQAIEHAIEHAKEHAADEANHESNETGHSHSHTLEDDLAGLTDLASVINATPNDEDTKEKDLIHIEEFKENRTLSVLEIFKINTTTQTSVCAKNNGTRLLYIKGEYDYKEQKSLCSKLNGNLLNWERNGTEEKTRELLTVHFQKLVFFTFVHYNGNCTYLRLSNGKFDIDEQFLGCDGFLEFICEVPMLTHVRMRYSVDDHVYPPPKNRVFTDHVFQVALDENEFNLHSRFGDDIYFDDGKIILTNSYQKVYESYIQRGKLFGRFNWYLQGDKNKNTVQTTTLTSCLDVEFTCNNGDCVSLSQHCDGIIDCDDGSDENCNLIMEDKSEQFRPPFIDTAVGFKLVLKDIEDIDGDDHVIKARIRITTTWHDPRISFVQLSDDPGDNLFNRSAINWRPAYNLPNVNFKDVLKYYRGSLSHINVFGIKISKVNASIHKSAESFIYNAEKSARIGLREELMADFSCEMDLKLFPFDVHPCSIDISIINSGSHNVFFDIEDIEIESEPQALHLFDVSKLKRREKENSLRPSLLTFEFLLTRRYTSFVLTTILPCIIIGLIGTLTHLFEKDNFSDRIMVTLSNLIVLASLFSQLSDSYPSSSEAKAIDVIFFFYIAKVSAGFVMHTIGGRIRVAERKKEDESLANLPSKLRRKRKRKITGFRVIDSLAFWLGLIIEICFIVFFLVSVMFNRQKIIDEFENIS